MDQEQLFEQLDQEVENMVGSEFVTECQATIAFFDGDLSVAMEAIFVKAESDDEALEEGFADKRIERRSNKIAKLQEKNKKAKVTNKVNIKWAAAIALSKEVKKAVSSARTPEEIKDATKAVKAFDRKLKTWANGSDENMKVFGANFGHLPEKWIAALEKKSDKSTPVGESTTWNLFEQCLESLGGITLEEADTQTSDEGTADTNTSEENTDNNEKDAEKEPQAESCTKKVVKESDEDEEEDEDDKKASKKEKKASKKDDSDDEEECDEEDEECKGKKKSKKEDKDEEVTEESAFMMYLNSLVD